MSTHFCRQAPASQGIISSDEWQSERPSLSLLTPDMLATTTAHAAYAALGDSQADWPGLGHLVKEEGREYPLGDRPEP